MTDTPAQHVAHDASGVPLSLNFECAPECGGCCRDLRLPLTIAEAIAWLERDGQLELLCEAIPWESEPAPDQLVAAHKRRRSFPAASGKLPIRVIVVLAARFVDGCPNLLPDMRCGIYHERPLVCRIYPAEINPFISLEPSQKMCPPSAWQKPTPFMREGRIIDAQVAEDIARSREADHREAPLKARVCAALGVDIAAFSTLGFAVHHPDRDALLHALRSVQASAALEAATGSGLSGAGSDAASGASMGASSGATDDAEAAPQWRFTNDRADYTEALESIGAAVARDEDAATGGARWERLSLG